MPLNPRVVTTNGNATSSAAAATVTETAKPTADISTGALLGIITATLVAVAILIIGTIMLIAYRRRRRRGQPPADKEATQYPSKSDPTSESEKQQSQPKQPQLNPQSPGRRQSEVPSGLLSESSGEEGLSDTVESIMSFDSDETSGVACPSQSYLPCPSRGKSPSRRIASFAATPPIRRSANPGAGFIKTYSIPQRAARKAVHRTGARCRDGVDEVQPAFEPAVRDSRRRSTFRHVRHSAAIPTSFGSQCPSLAATQRKRISRQTDSETGAKSSTAQGKRCRGGRRINNLQPAFTRPFAEQLLCSSKSSRSHPNPAFIRPKTGVHRPTITAAENTTGTTNPASTTTNGYRSQCRWMEVISSSAHDAVDYFVFVTTRRITVQLRAKWTWSSTAWRIVWYSLQWVSYGKPF
uniref:Uncharacterized protein n=1 Tax=Mycena chlorophos TaxID=658473 RepID=A0ABQ0LGE5_MYCCL|nr:predicted protein [Mycena chlorophos]